MASDTDILKDKSENKRTETSFFPDIFSRQLQKAKIYGVLGCIELVSAIGIPIVLFFAGFSSHIILIVGLFFLMSMGLLLFVLFNAFRCPQCKHFMGTTVVKFCPHCGLLVRQGH